MDYKWIGAVLIISACGGFGFSLISAHRLEELTLRSLAAALDYMVSELHFKATPLPELCRMAAGECAKGVDKVFAGLAEELDTGAASDVRTCMNAALATSDLPPATRRNLELLGSSLGRFDLAGQLEGLEIVRTSCRRDLEALSQGRDTRLRNYQTLSLCAGAALAILLI